MNKRKIKFKIFIFSSLALLASSISVIDLEDSSVSALVSSLTIHATVLKNDFPDCQNSTCDANESCKMIPRKSCGHPSCNTITLPTCIHNMTDTTPTSSKVISTGLTETISSHAPSVTSQRLLKRALKAPQLVEVDTAPPVFYPKRIGNGLLTSKELVAVALLTGDVHKSSHSHRGNGFTLDLHPKSWCKRLPDHFDIGLVLLDSISIQVNAAVGQALNKGDDYIDGAIFTTYYDGITDVFLYSHTTTKMTNFAARKYCRQHGMGLPTLTSAIDLARISPFTALAGDFWVDGSDVTTEGTWRSFHNRQLLNRMPWANGIEGRHRDQDCVKIRCDLKVNDMGCAVKYPVLCTRLRQSRSPPISKLTFTPKR